MRIFLPLIASSTRVSRINKLCNDLASGFVFVTNNSPISHRRCALCSRARGFSTLGKICTVAFVDVKTFFKNLLKNPRYTCGLRQCAVCLCTSLLPTTQPLPLAPPFPFPSSLCSGEAGSREATRAASAGSWREGGERLWLVPWSGFDSPTQVFLTCIT